MNSYSYVCFNYSILLHDVNRFFLFSSSSWLTPVHEKDLVSCCGLRFHDEEVVRASAASCIKQKNPPGNGMLPVKRTIKNNKFLYRQPCYGWRYFMLLLYIAHDISLVSLHAVSFEVVGCCSNLCN